MVGDWTGGLVGAGRRRGTVGEGLFGSLPAAHTSHTPFSCPFCLFTPFALCTSPPPHPPFWEAGAGIWPPGQAGEEPGAASSHCISLLFSALSLWWLWPWPAVKEEKRRHAHALFALPFCKQPSLPLSSLSLSGSLLRSLLSPSLSLSLSFLSSPYLPLPTTTTTTYYTRV